MICIQVHDLHENACFACRCVICIQPMLIGGFAAGRQQSSSFRCKTGAGNQYEPEQTGEAHQDQRPHQANPPSRQRPLINSGNCYVSVALISGIRDRSSLPQPTPLTRRRQRAPEPTGNARQRRQQQPRRRRQHHSRPAPPWQHTLSLLSPRPMPLPTTPVLPRTSGPDGSTPGLPRSN